MKKSNFKFLFIILAIILFVNLRSLNKSQKILIDPGHGGSDPGSLAGGNTYEKDINLEIAKKLSKELRSKGYKVSMTREDDSSLSPMERVKEANSKSVDLFISIHGNAVENRPDVKGIELLYYPSEEGLILAENLLEALEGKFQVNNSGLVAREDLIVLNKTRMPSLVVETGYLSNHRDLELLKNRSYQKKLARAMASGIENYIEIKR